jgi:tRNA modification GTPase
MAKLMGWEDTIVALATPPGVGAIGVIRLSGKNAITIVNEMFPSKNLLEQPTHTLHVGFLKSGKEVLDEVVVALYNNPKSYTGEDVVEISCHGSPFIQEKILQTITQHGCRIAKPGEFTQRAFLNGKLDLTQAEAVADLIASNTEASRNAALQNIRGGFSNILSVLREELIKFSALIELELDFSEEDVAFADRKQLNQLIEKLQSTTTILLQSFSLGNVIKNGVQVAIIGKPNAGKSTLLNTLLNENRAIVSEIAGTTRDTIEEVLNIDGIIFRLIDTAGIRNQTDDVIESIGVQRSYDTMAKADIVLYLFDVNTTSSEELMTTKNEFESKQIKYILVGNKVDEEDNLFHERYVNIPDILFISAKENRAVDKVKQHLFAEAVQGNIHQEATVITNARHYEALQKLSVSLLEVEQGLGNNIASDLIALDIRQALHFLGEITGEITNEDQLDFIFSKFCIGK